MLDTVISHCLSHFGEGRVEQGFKSLIYRHSRSCFELSLFVWGKIRMILNVCFINFWSVNCFQLLRRSHIRNTDRHTVIAEPTTRKFSNSLHNFAGNFVSIVPKEMIDQSSLISTERSFSNLSQKKLTIFKKNPPILHTSIISSSIYFLFSMEVYHHSSMAVWTQNSTYHLLACPKKRRFEDCRWGQVNHFVGISEPRQNFSKLRTSEENVPIRH